MPGTVWCQLQVRNYFSLTGKKDVSINVITQDRRGYLWLGTGDGLYKYDGREATPFSPGKKGGRRDITALAIEKYDMVWAGTRDGALFKFSKKGIDSISLDSKSRITSILIADSLTYVATYGEGLFILKNDAVAYHVNHTNGLSDDVIYKLSIDPEKRVWCGTDAGLSAVSLVKGPPVVEHFAFRDGLPDNIVRDISWTSNGLLIAMQDSGICYLDVEKRRIRRPQFFQNWTLGTVLNAVQKDSCCIMVATERNGLLTIEKGEVHVYSYLSYLQGAAINQLFMDREKQLWLASKKGLTHLSERRYQFISSNQGLSDQKILALTVDRNNCLWAGTSTGIISITKDYLGKIIVQRHLESDKYTVSCAATAPDGKIWFGTYGSGLIVFEGGKPVVITSAVLQGLNDNISHLCFTNSGNVLISTLGGGLVLAKVIGEGKLEIEKIYNESNGLGSDYVYATVCDRDDRVFVGSDGGGLQSIINGKISDISKHHMLGSNTVFSLCMDRHSNIWAVTSRNGIIKYNGKTIRAFRNTDGLRDEQPQQIISFDNTVFALNSKGIDKINCLNDIISYYDVPESELEPNLNAVCIDREKLYSGTNSGVFLFRTGADSNDLIKPVAALKKLLLNYKEIPFDSISEFRYNQNNFAFEFDGVWLKNPDKLLYRYKLQGLETEWQFSQMPKAINYNNLKPGQYAFVVQVKNEEDVWSEEVVFSFMVHPPIYMRWWFWILCLLAAAAIFYFVLRYRLKALQRENTLLEQRVKERTFQIERQSKIIEKKNAELEQLSLVASKTDNVVLILDAQGRLEYINESFEKNHGMSVDELKLKYGETIYELSNHPEIRDIVQEAVKGKRSVSYESLNRKVRHGGEVWDSSTLTPIFDEEGNLKKLIIIDTDVSLRKKQEQIITQKNKDITDSISYARKIQHAILPPVDLISEHLPHSFVLYMTKDIVSGDFYWFTHLDGISIIAAVDCTGHGVPGAFMSLIGYNQLNRIVNEEKITNPKNILLELNDGVLGVLHKNESESKDGMDIAICKIDHRKRTLEFAGAMRPLWIIRRKDGEAVLTEVRPDKIPIGTPASDRAEEISFTLQKITVEKGDRFYIFTDGYADQFGGDKDKKYSTARFKQLVISSSDQPMARQEAIIREEHLKWKGHHEQVDDILVIGFSL